MTKIINLKNQEKKIYNLAFKLIEKIERQSIHNALHGSITLNNLDSKQK